MYNRYSYVLNNPVRFTDPSGHCILGLPCPDYVENGAQAIVDFTAGFGAQWTSDNALTVEVSEEFSAQPGESVAKTTGRVAGSLVSIAIGVAEMYGGGTMMSAGGAACATGPGCAIGAPLIVGGTAVMGHGSVVVVQGQLGLAENVGSLTHMMSANNDDWWDDEEFWENQYDNNSRPPQHGNTPRNNQAQNSAFRGAVQDIEKRLGIQLDKSQVNELHRRISKQGYGYQEIVDEGLILFGDQK